MQNTILFYYLRHIFVARVIFISSTRIHRSNARSNSKADREISDIIIWRTATDTLKFREE